MNSYIKRLQTAGFVLRMHAKSVAFFRSKLIIDSFVTLFRVLVLMLVYVNIYKVAPAANNILPYRSALWSMGAYFFALAFTARRLFSYISQLIYTGNIELYLVRPMHVLLFNAAKLLGENLLQALITGATLIVTLWAIVGLPEQLSVSFVLWGIVLLGLGLTIELLIAALVGLSAIWLENAAPLYMLLDKFILILGGSYVPVAFFPEILKKISLYSPFGATRFLSYSFYPDFADKMWSYLLLQIGWIIILWLCVSFVFARGQKHLSVNGS